jgi:small conductance mechanosensitive channel
MHNWLVSTEGGLRWLRNIIFFVLTLFVFSMLSRALGRAAEVALARVKGTSDLLKNFLVNVIHKVTWIIGLVVALSMIEVDIGPLVAAIGATGFVVGFALQNTLSNFAAGIMLLLYRPFDIGNTVTVAGGTEGVVKDMSLVSTTLKTADGHLVVVPNSAIWGAVIVNKQAV